jgi:hypothetical protein
MLNKYLSRTLCGAYALLALTSCGGAKSPGTAEFATVFATATPPAGLDSDVAQWFDAATVATKSPACAATSVATVKPDDVVFTVQSTAYSSADTGSTNPTVASDLVIDKITMTFTKANSLSPDLPALFQTQFPSAGQTIKPGSNNVSIRVVSDDMKRAFLNSLGTQSLTCGNQGTTYSYRVNVSFHAIEVNTNREGTITPAGAMLINFSDFIDS